MHLVSVTMVMFSREEHSANHVDGLAPLTHGQAQLVIQTAIEERDAHSIRSSLQMMT